MTQHDKLSSGVEVTARSEQVAAPSQGRRRFTKGALLATPAVMTLMSGRLAAAASSCAARVGLVPGTSLVVGSPQTQTVQNPDGSTTTTTTTPTTAVITTGSSVEINVTVVNTTGGSSTTETQVITLDYETAVSSGLISGQQGVGNSCLNSMV